ncbi:MAG TPA: hypothetical protein EYO40_00065 [Phycisphaerales bacterium]|nr:hypothetical protein [Phycisphaerales bacterium]
MNANVRHHVLALTIAGCGFIIASCEAPPEVTQPRVTNLDSTVVAQQTKIIKDLRLRLLESYMLHWPLVSSEYQHDLLPSLLHDQFPELRAFGIERVAVLLRDGEATEEELQFVVNHLRDLSPTVRLAAAQLLPEINIAGLSEYVANSLAHENDQLVIEEELSFFRTRPNPKAIEPTIALLSYASVNSAADTLIVLLSSNKISDDTKQRIVKTVQKRRRTINLPSLITLESMLGDQNVKRKLIRLLNHQNKEIRTAVARGFASSGFADPLIERANNPEFYEYALSALQERAGIESFEELMDLYKPENESWRMAAFAVATKLDTSSLLRADDMLRKIKMNELRLFILNSIWDNAEEKNHADLKAIAKRAVPLMISSGDAVGALQLLDVFGESLIDEDLLSLRFAAAISASAWDAAADAQSTPGPWIIVWQSTLQTDPIAAAVIKQQITLRFEDLLTPSQRELLGIVQVDATQNQEP